MAAGIEKAPTSSLAVPKWQLIFIILGVLTIAWGFVLYFFLADGPSNAFWLKPAYRTLAVGRVASNVSPLPLYPQSTKSELTQRRLNFPGCRNQIEEVRPSSDVGRSR